MLPCTLVTLYIWLILLPSRFYIVCGDINSASFSICPENRLMSIQCAGPLFCTCGSGDLFRWGWRTHKHILWRGPPGRINRLLSETWHVLWCCSEDAWKRMSHSLERMVRKPFRELCVNMILFSINMHTCSLTEPNLLPSYWTLKTSPYTGWPENCHCEGARAAPWRPDTNQINEMKHHVQ